MVGIKKIIKFLFFKFYSIGQIEAEKRKKESRIKDLNQLISYNSALTKIDENFVVLNHRKNKNFITIGDYSWVRGQLMILAHGGEITIGKHCFIGENSRIWSSKKIVIGDRVLISHNVNIHDNISHPLNSTDRHKDYLFIYKYNSLQKEVKLNEAEIFIGNDVWIGFNATIMKGVTIGNGAIIGANTVILKDVDPFTIVVGNPARVIKNTL